MRQFDVYENKSIASVLFAYFPLARGDVEAKLMYGRQGDESFRWKVVRKALVVLKIRNK